MCGIAGILHFSAFPVDLENITSLLKSLNHRGPDGHGTWINNTETLALIHTRLAILDLTNSGSQPMSYLNDRYHIVMNGEIYNFIEIREELKNKNYIFNSASDTEVVLAAYHEYGEKMLDHFNGMWAFAIHDSVKNTLFLSRDRFGVKPLYYYKNNDRLIFASEVQSIHKVLGYEYPLDEIVIKTIAQGGFTNHGTNRTYLSNVYSLPGGFNLTVKDNELHIEEWYQLKRTFVHKSFKKQARYLKELLIDSCKLRLRSDVSVGTCLSGGIDSGSITAIINEFSFETEKRFSNYSFKSFCAAFPNTPIDEQKSAQFLSDKIGCNLDILAIDPPTNSILLEALKQCDGPMHSLAFYPIWLLYKNIKKSGIKVTLDGQGPDEMLGGYKPIKEALQTAMDLKKPFWFWDVYFTYAAQGESSQFSSKKVAKEILSEFFPPFNKYIVFLPFKAIRRLLSTKNKKSILTIDNNTLHPSKNTEIFSNDLDKSLFHQFFQDPLPGILNQFDRCSMANGVECRMPFMDYRIVEFVFSLPVESKIGRGYTKRVLRKALKGILPNEVRLNKKKIGFNAPIVDWFKSPLKDFMLEIMNYPEFLTCKYFDGVRIRKNFHKFLQTENPQWNEAWQFWPPVHIIWWLRMNNIKCDIMV